jgi:nicotinate phosphoribosyltransferase
MDIVEIEGEPVAKRGKMSGAKQLWRDPATLRDAVLPLGVEPSEPGRVAMLQPLMEHGHLLSEAPAAREIREHLLRQLLLVADEVAPD